MRRPRSGVTSRSRRAVRLGGLVVAALAFAHAGGLAEPARATAEPPSIVVVLTDDQRWDSLWAMPTVKRELMGRGVTFTNAFVTNPLCCPSRATILTGAYSHDTGVWANAGPYGGAKRFDDSSTIATWLQSAGYRTGFVGKYLTGIGDRIPPGWDRWFAINGGSPYFDYTVNDDGTVRSFGTAPKDYSTDVFAAEAVSFIQETTGPLFLFLSPYAPHAAGGWRTSDPIPAPRHAGTFSGLDPARPQSFDESDVSDKPPYIRDRVLTPEMTERIDSFRRLQLESLQAVDEAVAGILDALRSTGRLDNAVIVYTSDNGFSLGEHRWVAKWAPYDESIRVPLVVRHDPLTAGARSEDRLVVNVDLAPTLARLAGTSAPGAGGASLVPLLSDAPTPWRKEFVLESRSGIPPYCGIRAEQLLYAQYKSGFEEIYDLTTDPHQLENLAGKGAYRRKTVELRTRVREMCKPRPPGLRLMPPCLVPGTPVSDRLRGTRRYDLICGKSGADWISARSGPDDIRGGSGPDRIDAGSGADTIAGGPGADEIAGGSGADSIAGGDGRDVLTGDGGADRLLAGAGSDRVRANDGVKDLVSCGPGKDTALVDRLDEVQGCERVRVRRP